MIEIPHEFPFPRDAFERQRALVGARVAVPTPLWRPQRRGALVAAASAAVLGALVVTPAFGIGDRLLDLIQGPPAPPEVQTYFAANDAFREKMFAYTEEAGEKLHDRFSPVIAGEAQGVFAIESTDGPIYLWAAPTEDGRQCWLIQAGAEAATGRPYGSGSCDATEAQSKMRPGTLWTAERPSVKILHARVYDDAITRVEIVIEDGPEVSLPVVAGHALGTVAKEARVLAFVGRTASSDEVARTTLP